MRLNFEFMAQYLPWYAEAAKLTVRIASFGILLALLAGAVCATLQYYRVPVLRRLVAVYIELSRNTPLLVQLFFLYFGLPKLGLVLSAETCFEKNHPEVELLKYDEYADAYNALLDALGNTDTIAPAVQKGNTTLLDWLNQEIETLGGENFFHADYEATLAPVYGAATNPDSLLVEGGKVD